ncbi:hypothetical protein TNCV_4171161 [Trichonephila clavipes]|nr:hypothetical protein TNCV_4171161 [Trichonephila clavipes]
MWHTSVEVTFLVLPPSKVPVTIAISIQHQHVGRCFVCTSYNLGNGITNDDCQQSWCSRDLSFSAIYLKTAWRNLLEHQGLHAASVTFQTTSDCNFRHLLENKRLIKCFRSHT